MLRSASLSILASCFAILSAAACTPIVVGDGTSSTGDHGPGAGGSTSSSAASGSCTTASGSTVSSTSYVSSTGSTITASSSASSSGGDVGPVVCPGNYCSFGRGGYAFSMADGDPPEQTPTGMSHATLAADGSLCISGTVMALPASPTGNDYSNDWGAGIGVNLNQAVDAGVAGTFQLTGTGITVDVVGAPECSSIRVLVDQNGADPQYCAMLTPGAEIPWASFNTACWDGTGQALTGPPDTTAVRLLLTTSFVACPFTNFCITRLGL